MKLLSHSFAIVLASLASYATADNLSLDLNDDALRINYQHSIDANYQSDFAWTHVKDLGNSFSAGLGLNQQFNNDLSGAIGGKAVFQQHDDLPDGTAIAIGGTLRVTPAADKKLAIAASLYLAPNVLSFGDMDNYREFELRGEYKVSEQLTGYVGYRNNRADYDQANGVKLYDGAMIGAQFHF
ncbi:YfaZ family outer membrane protein [Agitococcus lubricus]|uniref:YfaZ n=1 Tax=Agitococcus lubricus TaxID=1077255 RepID=A0A2T5J2Q3_9GAMM|nr:YfaZ family outer membrane protein [Agitococcus lubricus]PTQ90801.1 YfaZ precursor [Agitococcus lubricus]